MDEIRRLVIHVDLNDDGNDRLHRSFRAHLYADLADGRYEPVLDDRGWASSMGGALDPAVDIWSFETTTGIESQARTVVGPDEPPEGMTYEEAERHYWDYLVRLLHGQRVTTDAATLRGLAMDVELSDQVRARLGR